MFLLARVSCVFRFFPRFVTIFVGLFMCFSVFCFVLGGTKSGLFVWETRFVREFVCWEASCFALCLGGVEEMSLDLCNMTLARCRLKIPFFLPKLEQQRIEIGKYIPFGRGRF